MEKVQKRGDSEVNYSNKMIYLYAVAISYR
jgi:hypothetical protein